MLMTRHLRVVFHAAGRNLVRNEAALIIRLERVRLQPVPGQNSNFPMKMMTAFWFKKKKGKKIEQGHKSSDRRLMASVNLIRCWSATRRWPPLPHAVDTERPRKFINADQTY